MELEPTWPWVKSQPGNPQGTSDSIQPLKLVLKWVVNSPTNQNGIPLVLTHSHVDSGPSGDVEESGWKKVQQADWMLQGFRSLTHEPNPRKKSKDSAGDRNTKG